MPKIQREMLSPDIEERLRVLADNADAAVQRRARLILRWHEGATHAEIATEVGLSVSGIAHWLKQYRERGLELFGPSEMTIATVTSESIIEEPIPERPAPVMSEPEAPKPRRGRPPKAARPAPASSQPAIQATEVEPAPVPELIPLVEATPKPAPAKPRRGRPPKAAKPETAAQQTPTQVERAPTPIPAPPPQPTPTVRGLIEHYGVRIAHARHVAAQAAFLFDATAEIHRLPDRSRRLLEAGALLHNVAYPLDPAEHHTRGRDIILQTPLADFNTDERRMIALLTAFHRNKVHPEREPAYLELPAELRADTLALAALLRIADGSDRSQSQSTTIVDVQTEPGELLIQVLGYNAEADSLYMAEKADLWERLFDQRVRVLIAEETPLVDVPAFRSLHVPPALRDQMPDLTLTLDPALTGGRAFRTLALHYADRLDRLAARVRTGDDRKLPALTREIERLHGVLVLARINRFDAELRWLTDKTHAAQIAFAMCERAATLADDTDDPTASALTAGLPSWQESARAALELLDFARCDHLLGELRRELTYELQHTPTDESDSAISARVGLIVWEQLAALREAIERGESVHQALIAAYRLQDALLYFRSLIGPEAIQALDLLAPFENYLVTIYNVQSILYRLEHERKPAGSPAARAVDALRQAQTQALEELADNLPALWTAVNSPVFRRALALALAAA
ncbi:MAG: helix-turn-helix domain-containing protein [Aggregatilineales bacterium]